MKIWASKVDGERVLFAEWWCLKDVVYPIRGSVLPFRSGSVGYIDPLQNDYSFNRSEVSEPSGEEREWYANRLLTRMEYVDGRRAVKYFFKGENVLFEVERIDMKEGLIYAVQGSAYPSKKWQVIEEPLFCLTCYAINDAEKEIYENAEGV